MIKNAKSNSNGALISDSVKAKQTGKNRQSKNGSLTRTPEEKKAAKRKAMTLEAFGIAYDSNQKNR